MRSRISGFYQLSPDERVAALIDAQAIDPETAQIWRSSPLPLECANSMVENVVGTFELPNAVAVNLRIDGRDRIVPMVVEEPSVVAAVSNMARLCRHGQGIQTDVDPSVMIGQVQLVQVNDPERARDALEQHLPNLSEVARNVHPRLEARGGGLRGMKVREITYDEPGYPTERMVVLEFYLDCCDAMGANMVNTVAEHLAPHVEAITGERVGLRILSNLASQRLARANVRIPVRCFDDGTARGADVAEGIASAWRFAWADPWRATTHNKGVMNGIDAVALATGNDWRAIESGAHAWCARDGQYRPMTTWRVVDEHLEGSIELPTQFGTVGGPIKVHPKVQANHRLLGSPTARELAGIAVSVGLVQNLGALRALASEGIQAGHMRMHARTVALAAGATPDEIPDVVEALCAANDFSSLYATTVLTRLRAA